MRLVDAAPDLGVYPQYPVVETVVAMRPAGVAGHVEPPGRYLLLQHVRPGTPSRVCSDNQAAILSYEITENPTNEVAPATVRYVLQAGPYEIETLRWRPSHYVPCIDPVGPASQPVPGEVGQLRRDIEAVRLDAEPALSRPSLYALHQIAVGATDVQKGAIPLYCVAYETSGVGPFTLITTPPGLAPWRIGGQISGRDDCVNPAVPPQPRRSLRLPGPSLPSLLAGQPCPSLLRSASFQSSAFPPGQTATRLYNICEKRGRRSHCYSSLGPVI